MKKLNRKGFTLVELLAVIVILAIVVGITLVTVLPTIKQARQEAFNVTAQTAAEYFTKEYELYVVGQTSKITASKFNATTLQDFEDVDYTNAGLKSGNYDSAQWYIVAGTGRACVKLEVSTDGGDYNGIDNRYAYSDACPDEVKESEE